MKFEARKIKEGWKQINIFKQKFEVREGEKLYKRIILDFFPFFSFLKTILDFYRIIISKSIFLQPRQESDKENKRNCMGSKYVFVN